MKLSLQIRYSLAVVCILAAIVGFMGIAHLSGFRTLISASTLATAKTVIEALYEEQKKQNETHIQFLARILADPVARSSNRLIGDLITAAADRPNVLYVLVHDEKGQVIAESGQPEKAGRSAPFQTAQALSQGRIVFRADRSTLHITAPLRQSGRQLGAVTVGSSLQATTADIAKFGGYMDTVATRTMRNFLVLYIGIAVMIAVIGLGIGIVMVRDMARPIRALARYMRRIGTGNYDQPLPFQRDDELGDLARELGHMAQNLKKMAQVTKLASLGELAVGVAHELNQPLNTIRLAAENALLSSKAQESDSNFTESKLKLISGQTAKMGELIQRMCVVGRAEGGRSTMDARESVRDAVSLLASQCEDQGIVLNVELPGDPAPVLGRRNELAQVMINLIANARDAVLERVDGGGDTAAPGQDRISVRLESTSENVVIEVADNGGGISPKLLERIFDPFFTTKEETKGTGLGLSISLGIIDAMGGQIDAANGDTGAVFTVRLPRAEDLVGEAGA